MWKVLRNFVRLNNLIILVISSKRDIENKADVTLSRIKWYATEASARSFSMALLQYHITYEPSARYNIQCRRNNNQLDVIITIFLRKTTTLY